MKSVKPTIKKIRVMEDDIELQMLKDSLANKQKNSQFETFNCTRQKRNPDIKKV